MRWPWQRKIEPDPRAKAAACAAARKLTEQQGRQADVDRVTGRLVELGRHDRFAEAVEAALARRHR